MGIAVVRNDSLRRPKGHEDMATLEMTGGNFITSLDVLGLKPEELIDGLEYVGVSSYLAEADEANVNLFI
jgi:peroxiredoxin family protein